MMVQVHIISKEGQMTRPKETLREFNSMLMYLGVTDEILNFHEAYNTQSENGELAPLS